MRNVLFVLEPLGTGKAWRELAIAEQLRDLFPAVTPHFLANPAAAALLRASGDFPVEDTLAPILPDAASVARGDDGTLAHERAAACRRLGPAHAREALRAARALRAELVVVDGLFAAPPVLKRAGFDVAFVTDHLRDAEVDDRHVGAALLRRAVVATTSLRFFVGEPGYLASPELRVWSRRFFRYTGPMSALSRLNVRECATLRDDLGLGRRKLVVVAGGSAFAAPSLTRALEAAQSLAAARGDVEVRAFLGPELALDLSETRGTTLAPPLQELPRHLAIADACVIGGGLSLLSECAGLRVPTLALPLAGDPLERRHLDWFAHRCGVATVEEPTAEAIAARLGELLAHPEAHRSHDAPDAEAQRRNADFVADLLAERLGRRRPA